MKDVLGWDQGLLEVVLVVLLLTAFLYRLICLEHRGKRKEEAARENAIAQLRSLREPSEAMKRAGAKAAHLLPQPDRIAGDGAADVWRAMVDAALAERWMR